MPPVAAERNIASVALTVDVAEGTVQTKVIAGVLENEVVAEEVREIEDNGEE